ncbi:hypothetical protein [Tranquillimonas alkanivorans]|uniref:Uncharacterized protein n=1 Tax=Tranquillimonas alkanivorans TaxID=441119 RepID=A0A1I5PRA0_9RHOB|nr:hypothetical protein [Tranquillimonas alkanivorans]SFP36513.1 hypothetical protein SAMN04488047_105216 [Tranquillimonas alkanivorans]
MTTKMKLALMAPVALFLAGCETMGDDMGYDSEGVIFEESVEAPTDGFENEIEAD